MRIVAWNQDWGREVGLVEPRADKDVRLAVIALL